MLSSFFIRNYRSILEYKMDFSYGEGKAPNGWQKQEVLPFLEAENKQRFVPCMAFFGANASGKTNLLKAISVLCSMLEARSGIKLSEIFDPNLLNPKFSDTTFVAEYILNGQCFEYSVTYNAEEILEETLRKNGDLLYSVHRLQPNFSPQILSDTYSQEKLSDILRVECSDGGKRQTQLFLNRIGFGYPGLNNDLKDSFVFWGYRFHSMLDNLTFPLTIGARFLAIVMNSDEDAALKEITDVVRRLDIDIASIEIVKEAMVEGDKVLSGLARTILKTGEGQSLLVKATHKDVSGKLVLMDFIKHESAGTQRLAGLVGMVLYILKIGGVLLVDELECSLHPLLMREIILLFKTRRHNPNGAQLIFTTHNTDVLDDSILRLSEIALVRKTPANGTLVRRLVDVKKEGEDIRNVTNFRKQYLAGFYSGVPHPAL